MGGPKQAISSGGFTELRYHQVGETISAGGLSGKIIAYNETFDYHEGLPSMSNTSNIYFKLADGGQYVEQMRVYKNRKVVFDFDWGHGHEGFKSGVVHVHQWEEDANGIPRRTGIKRYMNNYEMKKYGSIIRKANPKVKFR
ncbi:MAG: hypothetical protein IJ816_05260 [Alloprevotella sp.]|nr:hypothetical protein [Alloprevotella sp.]